jgi:hypothetical protein
VSVTISPGKPRVSVEDLQRVIDALVSERQALRSSGADHATIEANRISLVYWQQELARVLIAGAQAHATG